MPSITNSTGYLNAGLGHKSLYTNSSGYSNTGVGADAGFVNSTGINNTYVGYGADNYQTGVNFSNTTVIGANTPMNASNKILVIDPLKNAEIGGYVTFSNLSDQRIKKT